MKRLLLIAMLGLFMTGCEKEQVKCNCGLVLDDNVLNYSVKIRNNCSNNEKWFYLQPGDWIHAHIGSEYCITNVTSW